MKKQILVGVAFCSLCLNVYAFNPAAEKAQDTQPVSCNIPAMLNDAKNAQWFRPQCIRILAASEARGNLNQSQKAQLKKCLCPPIKTLWSIILSVWMTKGHKKKRPILWS